jgi:hypothetical protein
VSGITRKSTLLVLFLFFLILACGILFTSCASATGQKASGEYTVQGEGQFAEVALVIAEEDPDEDAEDDENDEEEDEEEEEVEWTHEFPAAKRSALNTEGRLNLDGLRGGIEYLHNRFKEQYADASEYLRRLNELDKRSNALKKSRRRSETAEMQLEREVRQLRRDALVTGSPLLNFDRLIFVKRYTFNSSHFYTDFIDGCGRFGGNICILSLKDGTVTEFVPEMAKGIFGRYDLSFDGKKVVFGWKRSIEEGFRLYEVGIDGKGLRQLTFAPDDEEARIKKYDNSYHGGTAEIYNHHTDDMHPCYLPDGGICFTSSRCEFGTLCDGPDILATTILYRIDGDGRNMEKLTNSSVSEFSPSMMEDGRLIYTRWEYVDKGQLYAKCLWAMRPDGSGSVEIFGNDIAFPPSLMHGRQIPSLPHQFVVLGTPHFPQSGIGTVIRLDMSKNIRTREPMTYITPEVDIRQEAGWNFWNGHRWVRDGRGRSGRLYMDPYPLGARTYLVACKAKPEDRWADKAAYGLYLLDEFGNHTLIYQESDISCWQPVPLRSRKKPPVAAMSCDPKLAEQKLAVCVAGTVKYLRIMEQVPRPWGCRRFWDPYNRYCSHTNLVSSGSVFGLKVMHGIVPVYEDGSAHFLVPADRNIYLEALDEDFLEIQRERTYVNYRPGERRSCVGCHEMPHDTPRERSRTPIALLHPPSEPQPQPGDKRAARVLHYPTDVQPVLDRHCVKCHGTEEPEAGLDLTGTMTRLYSRSYQNLMGRGLVRKVNEASEEPESTPYVPPLTIGSGASRLMRLLREGYCDTKLSREELLKISTWIDANCQFYGSYYGRKNIRFKDHPNFRPVPTFEEAISPLPPLPDNKR